MGVLKRNDFCLTITPLLRSGDNYTMENFHPCVISFITFLWGQHHNIRQVWFYILIENEDKRYQNYFYKIKSSTKKQEFELISNLIIIVYF